MGVVVVPGHRLHVRYGPPSRCFNSDFYQQIAVGRLLVRGQYTFGEDPFTFTSRGVLLAQPRLAVRPGPVRPLYSLPYGGAVVVAVKAALLAGLAGLLLATAWRPGTSPWVPACFVLLAILTASPRFYLQPACLSMVLLAACVWLLRRPLVTAGSDLRDVVAIARPRRPLGQPGPVVCPRAPARSGCSSWGLPASAASGRRRRVLEVPSGPARGCWGWCFSPAWGPACSARTTTTPCGCPSTSGFGKSGPTRPRGRDPQFRHVFADPWDFQGPYYNSPSVGLSPAGLCYFPLLALCLGSFILNFQGLRWWRALLTLALAVVSVLARPGLVPFFAIVAAPVAALNFVEFAARRLATARRGGTRTSAVGP